MDFLVPALHKQLLIVEWDLILWSAYVECMKATRNSTRLLVSCSLTVAAAAMTHFVEELINFTSIYEHDKIQ